MIWEEWEDLSYWIREEFAYFAFPLFLEKYELQYEDDEEMYYRYWTFVDNQDYIFGINDEYYYDNVWFENNKFGDWTWDELWELRQYSEGPKLNSVNPLNLTEEEGI